MSSITLRLASLLPVIFVATNTSAQTLSPQALIQINSKPDFLTDTTLLVDKGFTFQSKQYDDAAKKTEARWYFQTSPHDGEAVSAYLIKSVHKDQRTKTVFFLFNPYHYKDFVHKLKQSKYRFIGMEIVNNRSFAVFTKGNKTFMTTHNQDAANRNSFEIVVQTK